MTLINQIGIEKIIIYILVANLIAFFAMWLELVSSTMNN